jgi:hypothetical protein
MTDTARALIETKFPNYDKSKVDAILERASETSKKKDGVGLALVYGSALDALINMAEFDVRNTGKEKPRFADDDLDRVRLAVLGWGKGTTDAQKLTHRGQFARKYGDAAAMAEDQKWPRRNPNDKGMLAPRFNPYKKVAGLKKALRGDGDPLSATIFNQAMHGVVPPQPKLTKEQRKAGNPFDRNSPAYNMTEAGRLFKSDPNTARMYAAAAGIKI